ncbi:hypothetical protein FB451DRAFT_1359930 [Mycena latifolia]|nr:hypothetical protein FB451DRAFT_1359930 [Mycena latifolia]
MCLRKLGVPIGSGRARRGLPERDDGQMVDCRERQIDLFVCLGEKYAYGPGHGFRNEKTKKKPRAGGQEAEAEAAGCLCLSVAIGPRVPGSDFLSAGRVVSGGSSVGLDPPSPRKNEGKGAGLGGACAWTGGGIQRVFCSREFRAAPITIATCRRPCIPALPSQLFAVAVDGAQPPLLVVADREQAPPMLWASKRRKSRPDVQPKQASPAPAPPRRSSLGNTRLPFAPLDPHQAPEHKMADPQGLYGRAILTVDEQQRLARQHSNFSFGTGTMPPPSPGRSIGPLDELDEDDMRRRGADETPRQSLAGTTRTARTYRDPRTPSAYYTPPRSDAASHHTFGTSSASSLSSPSRSGSRSRTTSSTTHTSVVSADDPLALGGVTFNPIHHHPTLPPDVEFDSEEDDEEQFDAEYDLIEVSSARGGGSVEGAAFEAAFERQMYAEALNAHGGGRRPSLPMAIPGAPTDEIAAAGRHREREREGSLATLRRPSRSLDDQSILTLGPPTSTSGTAPVPAPATVSVPETDGDWRSLSARHLPPGPTIPTVPTFAARAPSPSSASPSGGGGIDGFGFDLDWSAMRAGITGLDMSDVAVHNSPSSAHPSSAHSSRAGRRPSQLSLMLRRPSTASGGSVMYDPDTFSAAVRGWGGEEYERQRKYWTFRRDAADGRGAPPPSHSNKRERGNGGSFASAADRGGGGLSPVRSITGGRVGLALGGGGSIMSGNGGGYREREGGGGGGGERAKHAPWRGMALNAEEIWNSWLVGGFKVRRIELRPQKPQQRVTIDPFRGPFTLGPKPPHDGAYTNIHKHSKVMAFSIHRHYKPTRSSATLSGSTVYASSSAGGYGHGHGEGRGSISTARGSVSAASRGGGSASGGGSSRAYEERRRPTAMILLAPRHVQEAYTSTNTTKGLRSHGLLDERADPRGDGRGGERGESRSGREREEVRRREKEREREKKGKSGSTTSVGSTSRTQLSSSGSTAGSAYTLTPPPPPPPPLASLATHTYPPPVPPRSASASRRRRRDDSLGLGADSDDDSDTERALRVSSRTTHNEAFSTMDASSLDQLVLAQDAARHGDSANVLSRVLRRAPAHPAVGAAPHSVYIPPWVTLQSRVKQEERRRRHDVLSNSFEDVGLLPPKKSSGGGARSKKPAAGGVDIFAQVPSDALFMLLPLWPGPTDPVSERNATKPPHEIPTEQRQYLLVSYKPTDERPPPPTKKEKKGSSHSSPTSSGDGAAGGGGGCDILLASYHISARLVSHADLQGSGVRVPDEGLAVLGPWHEAWLSMPQIATRDHGLLVIGTCVSREAGVEFDPEGLVKMGLCIPVPQEVPGAADELQEEPVAELTPIGKAVLEMAWIGCIAVTSFGPAGSSS